MLFSFFPLAIQIYELIYNLMHSKQKSVYYSYGYTVRLRGCFVLSSCNASISLIRTIMKIWWSNLSCVMCHVSCVIHARLLYISLYVFIFLCYHACLFSFMYLFFFVCFFDGELHFLTKTFS